MAKLAKSNLRLAIWYWVITTELAITEVIDWNKKNLERELANEQRQREKEQQRQQKKNQSL